MQHATVMGVFNGPGQRRHDPCCVLGRYGPGLPPQPLCQRGTRDIGGGNVGDRANGAIFINRHDMGMVEPRRGMRFALKPLARLGRDQGLGLRHLERDLTA